MSNDGWQALFPSQGVLHYAICICIKLAKLNILKLSYRHRPTGAVFFNEMGNKKNKWGKKFRQIVAVAGFLIKKMSNENLINV